MFVALAQILRLQIASLAVKAAATSMSNAANKHLFRGRRMGTRNINRGTSSWLKDYLGNNTVYTLRFFQQRFQIPRTMFEKSHSDLTPHYNSIFSTFRNAAGKQGILSRVNLMASLRVLAT